LRRLVPAGQRPRDVAEAASRERRPRNGGRRAGTGPLRSARNEKRKASGSVQKRDLARSFTDPLPWPAPWRRNGPLVRWSDPEVHLRRNGTEQGLVQPQVGVVQQPRSKPFFDVPVGQRWVRFQRQLLLEALPKALDDGYRARLAHSPEALSDAVPLQDLPKALRGELRALVGDEVSRSTVAGTALRNRSAAASAVGSNRNTLAPRGIRAKTSRTTTSLKLAMR